MKVIDKRIGKWGIVISSEDCPFLTYPRSDVACDILEDRPLGTDTYCYFGNCPKRETPK